MMTNTVISFCERTLIEMSHMLHMLALSQPPGDPRGVELARITHELQKLRSALFAVHVTSPTTSTED